MLSATMQTNCHRASIKRFGVEIASVHADIEEMFKWRLVYCDYAADLYCARCIVSKIITGS